MTLPATAATRSSNRSAPGSRRTPVRHPRRISGPTGPARSSALAAAVAIPAPGIALPRRRPSRPTTKPRRRPARKATRRSAQGALRAIDAVEGVSRSVVLDRLIRGRAWIGLLAFALIGIVAMQLFVLQLNTGIGRTLTRVATLQRENAQLGIEDSNYSAESRIEPLAATTGMTLAPVGTVHFVAASPADVSRAAAALSTPIQAAVTGASETSGEESAATSTTSTTSSAPSTAATSETSTETPSSTEASVSSATPGSAETPGSSEASSSSEAPSSAERSGSGSGSGG